jgi:hypothetical protein
VGRQFATLVGAALDERVSQAPLSVPGLGGDLVVPTSAVRRLASLARIMPPRSHAVAEPGIGSAALLELQRASEALAEHLFGSCRVDATVAVGRMA